ncbi:MAG: InlB B-repeat-containing protein [Bacilli bacterium]|nr:InlB B-repeat-containing protein [Bacilli bacterium]
MKRRALLLSLISSFLLLSSCNNKNNAEDNSGTVETTDIVTTHSQEWLNGKTINIFTLNDFHGAIEEKVGQQMGLKKMGSFFKQRGAEENTIILDQGDTWQGSIYSNFNRGQLINDVMCEARFDARTVGNHDFDWGADTVIRNSALTYNDYKIPALAANIYDYNFATKTFGNTQQSQIGQPSTVITLENEIRVGVVGVIGSDQITSINSEFMYDYGFKDHVSIAKAEATRLREEEGCDFIICSIHADQEDMIGCGMEDYVDLVLCAHTHQIEYYVENSKLLYLQAGRNGEAYGEIHVTFTEDSRKNTFKINKYSENQGKFSEIDPEISSIVDRYNAECAAEANQVVAQNVSGHFYDDGNLVNLMCKAVIDRAEAEGHEDVILSYCNYARTGLDKVQWTYGDIYEAFPFDNIVYIIEVTGKEIYDEIRTYNWICKSSTFDGNINYTQKYKIACLDYLAFHTNKYRNYDFFPENAGRYIAKLSLNYRLILKEWLASNHFTDGTYTLTASNYDSNVACYNKDSINYILPTYTVTFNLNGGHVEDESQLVRTANISTYYSSLYPSPDPTKDDYVFRGWFLDSSFNYSADSRKVDSNRTLYAKWGEYVPADNTITASEIDFAGANPQNIEVADGLSVSVFWYRASHNEQYGQIQISSGGSFELGAPSDYRITHFHMDIYGTYDNLSFRVDSNNFANEGFVVSGSNASYDFIPNGRYVSMSNSTSHNVYIYSIQLELEAI